MILWPLSLKKKKSTWIHRHFYIKCESISRRLKVVCIVIGAQFHVMGCLCEKNILLLVQWYLNFLFPLLPCEPLKCALEGPSGANFRVQEGKKKKVKSHCIRRRSPLMHFLFCSICLDLGCRHYLQYWIYISSFFPIGVYQCHSLILCILLGTLTGHNGAYLLLIQDYSLKKCSVHQKILKPKLKTFFSHMLIGLIMIIMLLFVPLLGTYLYPITYWVAAAQ